MRKEFRRITKIRKKGTFLKNRFFLLGVGFVVILEFFLYSIVLLPFIQVREVRVQGNEGVSEHTIKSVVFDRLWGKFLFLPTASIFLVDTKGIQGALLKATPELETVNIQRKFPNILTVVVRERGVAAFFCQELHCVAIDNEGVAFKEAEPSPESIVIYGQGQSLNLREAVVKKDSLDVILEFAREAEHRSLFMQGESSFEIISETQIHADTQEGWSVYFTQTEDLSWQITKLQTVLENKIPLEKRKRLEYIDVRFGDQAYFKYR